MPGFSRLGLGTVQFGIPYGIANVSGQVRYAEVLRILARARDAGITFLDTARGYGTSEESLGSALAELGLAGGFSVSTKLDIGSDYDSRPEGEVLAEVAAALDASRRALGMDGIPVYQLHVPAHRSWRGGVIWSLLQERQREGAIGLLGVSMAGADVDEALACLDDPGVAVLQIPYNAFDQRWRRRGVLDAAARRGVSVVGRSAFLQGLLLLPEERVPPRLADAIPLKRFLGAIAAEAGMEVGEIALRYALSAPEISSTIIGVDSLEQLEGNIAVAARGPLPSGVIETIEKSFAEVPERLVVPSLWA
jgi:aryl-alcohol dehydrogenase-like predicted oxidoreductase